MDASASAPLQFGVLGLGPVWRQLKPALLAEPERFRVALVADQNRRRADDEAAELRCGSAAGPGRLARHPETDVLLLADPQWHGLWALEEAIRLGKPVLSAVPLGAEPARLEQLEALLARAERTVHFLEPWEAPALIRRTLDLQADALGPLLRLEAEWPQRAARAAWPAYARLLQLTGDLAEGSIAAVQAVGRSEPPLALHLEGKAGWRLLLKVQPKSSRSGLRIKLEGTRGTAMLAWPSRLRWSAGPAATHLERLPKADHVPEALARFHGLVWSGQRDEANHAAALAAARTMQACWRSACDAGRRLECE